MCVVYLGGTAAATKKGEDRLAKAAELCCVGATI